MQFNDSQSSSLEENGRKKMISKPLSRLSSRNKNFLHSNLSSEPNCESDSEGILTSRAIEKLTLNDGKRSIESDCGVAGTNDLPKKVSRRRRKTKRTTPMQIDSYSHTLKSKRERRSLGKRKRNTATVVSKKKAPITSEATNCDIFMSDDESVDSFMSGRTAETFYSQDEGGEEGDDEESDWPQDIGISNTVPLYVCRSSFLADGQNNTNNAYCKDTSNCLSELTTKDDFMLNPPTYNNEHFRNRSIKTGNRRLLTHNRSLNKAGPYSQTRGLSKHSSALLDGDQQRPAKRYSSKRLRCGSASLTSFVESEYRIEVIPTSQNQRRGQKIPKCQHYGLPPFKKEATEKLIFGPPHFSWLAKQKCEKTIFKS